MIPFLYNNFDNNFEYPLSGNVTQSIAPSFIAELKGVPEIEHEIVTRVSGYGDQLGAMMKVVLALAEAQGVPNSAKKDFEKLEKIAKDIKQAKISVKDDLKARAEHALKNLKDVDPDAYDKLIKGASD